MLSSLPRSSAYSSRTSAFPDTLARTRSFHSSQLLHGSTSASTQTKSNRPTATLLRNSSPGVASSLHARSFTLSYGPHGSSSRGQSWLSRFSPWPACSSALSLSRNRLWFCSPSLCVASSITSSPPHHLQKSLPLLASSPSVEPARSFSPRFHWHSISAALTWAAIMTLSDPRGNSPLLTTRHCSSSCLIQSSRSSSSRSRSSRCSSTWSSA